MWFCDSSREYEADFVYLGQISVEILFTREWVYGTRYSINEIEFIMLLITSKWSLYKGVLSPCSVQVLLQYNHSCTLCLLVATAPSNILTVEGYLSHCWRSVLRLRRMDHGSVLPHKLVKPSPTLRSVVLMSGLLQGAHAIFSLIWILPLCRRILFACHDLLQQDDCQDRFPWDESLGVNDDLHTQSSILVC